MSKASVSFGKGCQFRSGKDRLKEYVSDYRMYPSVTWTFVNQHISLVNQLISLGLKSIKSIKVCMCLNMLINVYVNI